MVVFAFGLTMFGTTLPTPLYVLYQQRFGFSTFVSTVVFAAYAVGVIGALLLFGRLSDLIGRKRTLLPALGCAVISGLAFLVADGVELLLVGRVLSGVSAGIFSGTATATLVDLAPDGAAKDATGTATLANMAGLGLGPLFSGLVAQWAPGPLVLPYLAHIGSLISAAAGLWFFLPETVSVATTRTLTRPRLRVPGPAGAAFLSATTAAFPGFAMLGLYTAIAPTVLRQLVERPAPALAGVVVFTVFLASAVGQVALVPFLRHLALIVGCCLLIASPLVLAVALVAGSLALVVIAGALGGLGQGVTLRAGLSMIHTQTPAENRAEVSSAFFVVMYVAISLPVVGVGIAVVPVGLQAAGLFFCAVMCLVAFGAAAIHCVLERTHRLAEALPEPAVGTSSLQGGQSC